jgi:hypothetical protein
MSKNREIAVALFDRINLFSLGWDVDSLPRGVSAKELIENMITRVLDSEKPDEA